MTIEEIDALLHELVGDDAPIEKLDIVDKIRAGYNDREEVVSGDKKKVDVDIKDFVTREEYERVSNDYVTLMNKYKERFWDGGTTKDEVKKDQEEDVKRDGTEQTYEELFDKREG